MISYPEERYIKKSPKSMINPKNQTHCKITLKTDYPLCIEQITTKIHPPKRTPSFSHKNRYIMPKILRRIFPPLTRTITSKKTSKQVCVANLPRRANPLQKIPSNFPHKNTLFFSPLTTSNLIAP